MSAYRPISKDDYMERERAGATNIGWAEGVGYYVEDRQALEEFWKASDQIKQQQRHFSNTTRGGADHSTPYRTDNGPQQPDGFINDYD